jgi:hypothetical protein
MADAAGNGRRTRALSRRRRLAVWTLIVLASLIGLISALTIWVDRQMFDDASWNDASAKVIQDPVVRNSLSVYVVNQLYDNVDVAAQLEQKLPPNVKPLAGPISAALREPAARAVNRLLGRPRVQQLWIQSSSVAHDKLTNVLENETGHGVTTGNGVVTLDLSALVTELGTELGLPASAFDRLPEDAGVVTLMESDQLSTAQAAVEALKAASAWLAVLVVALFAAAIYLARGKRRETLRDVGWAFVLVGMLVLIVRRLGGNYVIDALVSPDFNASGHRLWLIGTEILGETGRTAIFYGVIVVLAATLAGPMGVAVSSRRRLAGLFRHRPEIVWGTVAGLYLLLVLWGPTYALRRPIWILIFGVLLAVGVEVLRRQTLREFPADDELAKLEGLHDSGAIDDEEFDRLRQHLAPG